MYTGNLDTVELLSRAEIISSIPGRSTFYPTYSHSFGMTENFFIFCETPVTFSLFKLLKARLTKQPLNTAIHYDSSLMVGVSRCNSSHYILGVVFT